MFFAGVTDGNRTRDYAATERRVTITPQPPYVIPFGINKKSLPQRLKLTGLLCQARLKIY